MSIAITSNHTAALQGLSFDQAALIAEVQRCGWSVKKCHYDKKSDRFVAVGKASHGEEIEAFGPDERIALSNLLRNIVHRNNMRSSKLSMWTHTFTDQLGPIAEAYSKAPVYEPKAAIAFMELGKDSVNRAKTLREHLEVVVTNNPEPYKSEDKMHEDIRKRRRLEVSRAGLEHPVWSDDQALAYRIVHDVMGYCAANAGWDWQGENQAFAAHAAIVPEEAQKALFAESIGQTAYATYYQAYGPAKIALFPAFMDEAQDNMNPAKGHRGVHPSQMFAPIERPSVERSKLAYGPAGLDPGIEPGSPHSAAGEPTGGLTDPNEGYQTGIHPNQPNAYMDHGDPLQSEQGMDNAKLIDTEWSRLNTDDPGQLATMKQAITNAFRVVLLSPRKDLSWNAIHYQDISGIQGDESDPTKYWHTLEAARQKWNVERFGEGQRYSHMPYFKQWKALENLVYQRNPQLGEEAAKEEASQFLFRERTRIENQVMAEDGDKPEEGQQDMFRIELEANKRLGVWLTTYIKSHQMGMDFESAKAPDINPEQQGFDMDVPQIQKTPKMSKYGAFMGGHLQAISQVSEHVDEILKAALFDVHKRDGSGHHFRATVLQLGLSGVGPKVCSFAWLLLQPMTSQLATIDTHMMDVLGHNFEKDSSNRDYFKYERELQAGRDSSGYGHVPLGAFQWMMWDHKRTGPGSHQDHSAMKVLDPLPHDSIDWANKAENLKGDQWLRQGPAWWQATGPARQAVADDWDQKVAPNIPKGQIPYNRGTMPATYSKTSSSTLVPWFQHPDTGARIQGSPGLTLMQHARSVLGGEPGDIWSKLPDESVGKS